MAEKFEEKTPGEYDKFEKKGELWTPKEEKGHVRDAEEIKEAREEIPEEKKVEGREEKEKKAEEWYETFTKLGGSRRGRQLEEEYQREKKEVESAKTPEKGMEREEILKKAGIEKPAESFDEAQERLDEKLKKAGGVNLSLAEKNEITREFYRSELGYKIKYKGLLHGKAELLDESGEKVAGEKGKPMEFKTFFKTGRKETPMIDFLKERMKEKVEGKPEKEAPEEKKEEAGLKKMTTEAENKQETREAKISALQETKRVGMGKLSKLVEGLAHMAGAAASAFKECKGMAIDGAKDLTALGLSPAMAIEEAGREIAGRVKLGESIRKELIKEGRIKSLEKMSPEERTEGHNRQLESLRQPSEKLKEEQTSAWNLILKKGKILSFLESWTWPGGLGKEMGERLTPHPSGKENKKEKNER